MIHGPAAFPPTIRTMPGRDLDSRRAAARSRREALRRDDVGATPVLSHGECLAGDGGGAEALDPGVGLHVNLHRAAATSAAHPTARSTTAPGSTPSTRSRRGRHGHRHTASSRRHGL